jgi:hypothetical protein
MWVPPAPYCRDVASHVSLQLVLEFVEGTGRQGRRGGPVFDSAGVTSLTTRLLPFSRSCEFLVCLGVCMKAVLPDQGTHSCHQVEELENR